MTSSRAICPCATSVAPRSLLNQIGHATWCRQKKAEFHTISSSSSLSRLRLRPQAEAGDPSNETKKEVDPTDLYKEPPTDEPTFIGRFFGSYLQLAVWIITLSFAGYKGFQLAQTDPSSVGLLVAPPAGALFLIIAFLLSRFGNKEES